MGEDFVDLDRQFRDVSAEEAQNPLLLYDLRFSRQHSWADLRIKKRVIVLAEAGSGKTTEFKRQWRASVQSGDLAFYATVQELGRGGFENALGAPDLSRFETWKTSESAIGLFFLDSVDEAKDDGVSFERAVRNLAKAIAGREERARIFISGRFTDWDFIADRKSIEEWLTIPAQPAPLPSLEEQVRDTLQSRKPETASEAPENVSVVLMTPLDEPRVRRYASSVGVSDTDRFIEAVASGNLWHFAKRPLDLEWMAEYWQERKRLGTLAEMLKVSIQARLVEKKPDRKRRDSLSVAIAELAIERIGAGLLLCERDAVRVPSEGVRPSSSEGALSLEALLPDWEPEGIMRLLGRPVFDPATLGRVRLHNDNEGTVRSYLTGRWLAGRLAKNCPSQQIDDLLFADLYGYALVRPDMRATAAWLSIWNPQIAEKLIAREPLTLLTQGDPGALPVPTRIKAIEGVLHTPDQINRRNVWPSHDALRRFADPAFDALIPEWWRKYAGDRETRRLLLQLIWLGKQSGGLQIVKAVAFEAATDSLSQQLAARALLEVGTTADALLYAEHIVANAATLPRSTVLAGLDGLFPKFLTIDRFFATIDVIGVTDKEGVATVWPLRDELADRLNEEELTNFLRAVLPRMGPLQEDSDESPFVSAFSAPAVSASLRLIELRQDVPDEVVDLVLRLHAHSSYRGRGSDERKLGEAICSSPKRRRQSLWRAAYVLRQHPWMRDSGNISINQMRALGWPVQLGRDDLPWLLEDAATKPDERDRRLAFEAAYRDIWCNGGKDDAILHAIAAVAGRDQGLNALFNAWQSPEPDPPERLASLERLRRAQEENEASRQKRDNSWIKFIGELRADPNSLDRLQPQTDTTADARLVSLYRFLSSRIRHRSHFAIDDLAMVEPIFGSEVTKKFGNALTAFAYARWPLLPSERPAEDRRKIFTFDNMGLAGMSLEAAARSNWAETLSSKDAERAARYGIGELNGFPDYFLPLAAAHPDSVRKILATEITAQLSGGDEKEHGILDRLTHADPKLAKLVAPDLEAVLSDQPTLQHGLLRKVTGVVVRAASSAPASLAELVHSRALATSDPATATYMLSILFAINGDKAADTLRKKTMEFDQEKNASLYSRLLPWIVGERPGEESAILPAMSFANFEELVLMAFEHIPPVNDVDRPSGEVYSPDWRDHAKQARDAAFTRFHETPGEATHAALIRLSKRPDFPIPGDWLQKLARERAEKDAILAAWRPEDVVMFENDFHRPPSTTNDLQLLAFRHVEQIARELHDGRFALGDIVQALPDENAVQRWFGDRFEVMQGNAYTVVRESHVAGEKEPDITLTSRVNGIILPIEVKVVDEMTVSEMEAALETQLCGQYLRHPSARNGVLLLVHQKPRPQGWVLAGHTGFVPIAVVLEHLRERARAVRSRSPDGPQPIVVCVDVSTFPLRQKTRKPRKKTSSKRAKRSVAARSRR